MRILLTGATGFIGSHLKTTLEVRGHVVTVYDRNAPLAPQLLDQDLIINCAGQLADPDLMWQANVYLTSLLLAGMKLTRTPQFIQIGSSSETGPMEGARREDSFCAPSNMYEATKLAATNLCLGYATQYDLNICVARPFSVYGPGDKPRKMLPMLWDHYVNRKPFNCYVGGHDWIHVDDFVAGILALIANPDKTRGRIFNFGTGINTSNRDVVDLFNHSVGWDLIVVHHDAKLKPYDVTEWYDGQYLTTRTLDWKPTVSLLEGINSFVISQSKLATTQSQS